MKISPEDGSYEQAAKPSSKENLIIGQAQRLVTRSISQKTCEKWNYVYGYHPKLGHVQIANYADKHGQPVAQKLRTKDKDFTVTGDLKKALPLYGQHLWRSGGPRVVITEGELDALSISEAQQNKWPVVSLPSGASSAKKAVADALEWLESFETVVLCFDNDEPGRKAIEEAAPLLSPGKVQICSLPLKDASEMLQAGRNQELINCLWNSSVYRPDGIVAGTDLWEELESDDAIPDSIPYPWAKLNELSLGLRQREIVTITAGSGIGKSAVCRELAYHLMMDHKQTVGYVALEESTTKSALGLMSINANKPLHLDFKSIPKDELRKYYDATLGLNRLYFYDHFGSMKVSNLLSKLRYLAVGVGCQWIVLDHLSIVISGIADGDVSDVKRIDMAMTAIRSLAEETGVGIILVSHLKRAKDKTFNEGGQVSLNDLRGSAAIEQLSDIVLALERDQQGEQPNHTTLRILKNRFTGQTGYAGSLIYTHETGRLSEEGMFDDSTNEGESDY